MIKIKQDEIKPRLRHANYFKPDYGKFWGFRKIPDFELILIIKGRFEYENNDCCRQLNINEVLCIPPGEEHKFISIGENNLISCIHFDLLKSDSNLTYCPEPYPDLVTKVKNPEFYNHIFKEIAENFQRFTPKSNLVASQAFKLLWIKLSKYWSSEQVLQSSEKVQAMLNYIKQNVLNDVDRNSIAEHFGYTPEYINYLFKKELSLTPTQFINREKIFIAFEMMKNGVDSIRAISDKLGFCDQYHFSKVFKKIIGKAPNYYKRKHR